MHQSISPCLSVYDARGNRYAVAHPAALGALLPLDAASAARAVRSWAPSFLQAALAELSGRRVDGIIIGPFGAAPPFDVLILNTDGSLAERSGNGLTIFARAMVDLGRVREGTSIEVRVHHGGGSPDPLITELELCAPDKALVRLGRPSFGPSAVSADEAAAEAHADGGWRLTTLTELNPSWGRSVFVRVGNPHCVTFVEGENSLPDRQQIEAMSEQLRGIAFAPKDPASAAFSHGVNLQWAAVAGSQVLAARIFERGEGWTQSSGTSASAVAAAAFLLGEVREGGVAVRMPGGKAEVILCADAEGRLEEAVYVGRAYRLDGPETSGD